MSLSKDEKCRLIADAVSSRKGRMQMAASMAKPIGGSGRSPCLDCALSVTTAKICEKIRPPISGQDCLCPMGTFVVWDEQPA